MIGYSDLWWLMLVEEGERFKCSPLITINSSTYESLKHFSCILYLLHLRKLSGNKQPTKCIEKWREEKSQGKESGYRKIS